MNSDTHTLKVTRADMRAFGHHVYVNHEFKFLVCTIPKVACTQWIMLFLRMSGVQDWTRQPHVHQHRPLLSKLKAEEVTSIMNDPTWTRAVFFRDPAERLLSAYLDKFVNSGGYITRIFPSVGRYAPLEAFLHKVLDPNTDPSRPEGLHHRTDTHWRPQQYLCGLEKFLCKFNYIGNFAHLQDHARILLQSRGIWQTYGQTGWGDKGGEQFLGNKNPMPILHAQAKLHHYHSVEQLKKVRDAYKMDYEMLERLGLRDKPLVRSV